MTTKDTTKEKKGLSLQDVNVLTTQIALLMDAKTNVVTQKEKMEEEIRRVDEIINALKRATE